MEMPRGISHHRLTPATGIDLMDIVKIFRKAFWMIAVAALLLTAVVHDRASGGGVTVITHGFNSDIESWIIPMAEKIPGHAGFPGTQAGRYRLKISSTSSPAIATRLAGVAPTVSDSGEVVICLDWSAVDGLFQATTTQVAQLAVNALTDSLLTADTGGRPLVELPLHLIGHSRGASVVTEMARLLGQQGIWVDQVTTLDPYPILSDATVRTWKNVLFADNIWQNTSGEAITGQAITGAYNRKLLSLGGGNDSAHSDVHLWYHGTIDLATPATDTQATIEESQRTSWWTAAEARGTLAGFHYSRLGGGNRLDPIMPAGAGTNRVRDGFNGAWDLGGDLVANRTALASNSGLWPNVIRCQRTGTEAVVQGGTFNLAIHYQAGMSASGNVALTVLLDPDANPWNGNEIAINAGTLVRTGPNGVGFADVPVSTSTAPAGTYRIAVRLADSIRERVLYADSLVEIVAAHQPPSIQGNTVRIEGGLLRFTVRGSSGATLSLQAAQNLVDWVEIATRTMTSDTWEFSDPDTALYPARFYRVGETVPPP